MNMSNVRKNHVYFGCENKDIPKDNSITLKRINPRYIQVHLGFLQYHHVYNISIDFPKCHFSEYSLTSILNAAEKSPPNVNCKIISINQRGDFYEMVIEFNARKERLLKEELIFNMENKDNILIEISARVLGPGKGTPLLKNGIKCIGIDSEELSDISDWQAD